MDGWGEGELRVVAPYADDLEEIDALVSDAFGRYLAHTRERERDGNMRHANVDANAIAR